MAKRVDEQWSPQQYFLRNDFCPPELIQERLDLVRRRAGASWAALLTIGRTVPLRSLTMMSAAEGAVRAAFASAVEAADFRGATPAFRTDAVEAIRATRAWGLFSEDLRIAANRVDDDRHDDEALSIWLFTSPFASRRVRDSRLRELAVMVNATAVAHSSRDHRVSALVGRSRRVKDGAGEPVTAPLLEIAASVVARAEAVFYTFMPASGLLERSALSAGAPRGAYPKRVSLTASRPLSGETEVVRRAFGENRSYMYPDIGFAEEGADPNVRLVAIPVPSAPYGRPHPNLGVLVVGRRGNDAPREFNFAELTLLRNVALRLALEVALSRADRLGRELTRLTEGVARHLQTNSPRASVRSSGLPADLAACQPDLQRLAELIQSTTASNSVTMRAVVPIAATRSDFVLRRFVAVPTARFADAEEDVKLKTSKSKDGIRRDSVNAFVAGTGELAYVYDTRKALGRTEAEARKAISRQVPGLSGYISVAGRPDLGSELCVPILCDGMIVATLNLESATPHNYDAQLTAIETFAALAGLVIGMRRRAVVTDLSERLARIRMSFHESRRAQILFRELLESQLDTQQRDEVELLKQVVFPSGSPVRNADESVVTFDLVAETEAHIVEWLRPYFGRTSIDLKSTQWRRSTLEAYREAMREVVGNLRSHRSPFRPSFTFGFDIVWLGYRRFDVVRITNRPSATPRLSEVAELYRVPVDEPEESTPHLGCYTAGELMRGAGGDMYALINAEGLFETRILIPTTKERS